MKAATSNSNSFLIASHKNPYLEYISTFTFDTSLKKPVTLESLSDGIIFYQLLATINDFKIPQIEAHPQNFIQKLANLKTIVKSFQSYWENILVRQLTYDQIDLVEIAHHQNLKQIQKLGDLLIKTAVLSESNQLFIQKMLLTSPQSQDYFMKIVSQTMQIKNTINIKSPRKEKQIKMYDKLIELQHQNQKLQLVITDLCQQKIQSEIKSKMLLQKLTQKDKDIQKLNQILSQYTCTPQKRRNLDYLPDTTQKHMAIIDQLSKRIDQLQIHQQELIHKHQLQKQDAKQMVKKMKQIQMNKQYYEMTLKKNQEYCEELQKMQHKFSNSQEQFFAVQAKLKSVIEELQQARRQYTQMEQKLGQYLMELQIKNLKIDQLITIIQNKSLQSSPCKNQKNSPQSNQKNSLFGQCQQFYNQKQNSVLLQSNKNLRIQIDRTSRKLLSYQAELQKKTKQVQKMRIHQIQNKKLVDIISHMSSYRGEENDILLECIYQLKMKQISKSIRSVRNQKKQKSIANTPSQNQLLVTPVINMKKVIPISIDRKSQSYHNNQNTTQKNQFQTPIILNKRRQTSKQSKAVRQALHQSNHNFNPKNQ